jgi:osmotically-inducible protein OsmY
MSVDPLIGRTIAQRYRVIRKLGPDGLGSVYLAEELTTGNRVAVKVFPRELHCDHESLKHCWSEARFATASSPSAVVRVYRVDRAEGRAFIVMEHLEGESLAELIRREGPLEVDRALHVATQIAQALAATSRAGIVHRDLKPQNVMVAPDDSVKLTDFGVARLRETASGGHRTGSPDYTAPEELEGADVTVKADVYSLGAILYAMLAGAPPSAGAWRGAGDGDELGEGPLPVRAQRPEVPASVERLVAQALEREPERRPGGMEAFLERLREVADSPGADAEPDAPPDAAPRAVGSRPRRRTLALAGAAGLVVAGLMAWSLLDWRGGGRAPAPPPVATGPQADQQSHLTAERPPPRQAEVAPAAPAARRAAPVAKPEEERRRQARVETPRRPDEGTPRPAETEVVRRAGEERRRGEVEASRLMEDYRRRLEEAEAAARRAEEERRRLVEAEATRRAEAEAAARRAEEERRQRVEAEAAARRAEEERRRLVEAEAARRAEEERRQAEAEAAARRAEEERRQRAEAEAAARRAEEERRRQAAAAAARQADAARAQASPPAQVARPAEPAPALSAQELARIRTEAEQRLLGRGLLRVSSADRWGVTLDIGGSGVVALSGVLRDMPLYHEAIRIVREVPGVQDVRAAGVRVPGVGAEALAQGDSARIRAEIQQRLRSRGLLRESPADRWGVTVEVGADGEVTLVGLVRDAGLQGEAVRLVQGVPGVRRVKQDIRVAQGAGRQ